MNSIVMGQSIYSDRCYAAGFMKVDNIHAKSFILLPCNTPQTLWLSNSDCQYGDFNRGKEWLTVLEEERPRVLQDQVFRGVC
jgi:hypothetical protein